MRTTFTDKKLADLRPPARGRLEVQDALVDGLLVRVTSNGHKSFALYARFPLRRNRETKKLEPWPGDRPEPTRRAIGDVGKVTIDRAREIARHWHQLIQRGVDPATEQARLRREEKRARDCTFRAVAEEYVRRHLRGKRRAARDEREIRRELIGAWGDIPIAEITRGDVTKLVEGIADRTAAKAKKRGAAASPRQAHNVFGHARSIFNWAIARGTYGIEASPCDRLKPAQLVGRKPDRQRVLDDAELRVLWRASGKAGHPYGPLFRLLLLTGARRSEVAEARWREFDLERKLWVVPPERFKSDAEHRVPLSDDALALLADLPRPAKKERRGDFVFSTTSGEFAVDGFSKAKARLDRLMLAELREDDPEAELRPFVLHDLRRTVRTRLSELRVPFEVAELVVGHAKRGLSRVYDQHEFADEMRGALEQWAARLRLIASPPEPGRVLPMRKGKRA